MSNAADHPRESPPVQAENPIAELTVQELEPEEAAAESEGVASEIREKIARGYSFE
jgi:hypothetical protein